MVWTFIFTWLWGHHSLWFSFLLTEHPHGSLCWFLLISLTSKHWNGPGLSPRSSSFLCLHSLFGWCPSLALLCIIYICFWLLGSFPPGHTPLLNSMLMSTYLLNTLLGCLTDIPCSPKPNFWLPSHTCSSSTLACFTKRLNSFIAQDKKKWIYPWLSFLNNVKCISSFVF